MFSIAAARRIRYNSAMNLPKHMPALDGLRGVAVLMVLLTHAGRGLPGAMSIYSDTASWPKTFALPFWFHRITDSAEHGVQLFFVISAFTLTLRVTENSKHIAGYALRRISRVGPAYWLAGLGYTLLAGLAPRLWAPAGIAPADLVIAGGFLNSWMGGASLAVVPGGWSVACEVAFYIALPLLIWAIDGRIWRVVALTALCTVVVEVQFYNAIITGTWDFAAAVNPLQQAPVFLCGITAALVAMRFRMPYLPGIVATLLLLATVNLPQTNWQFSAYLESHLAFAGLVAAAVALSAAYPMPVLSGRILGKIGEVSYSMYLLHFVLLAPSLRMAEMLIPGNRWPTMLLHFAITALATFIGACVTYRVIERPAIDWAASRTRRVSADATVPAE